MYKFLIMNMFILSPFFFSVSSSYITICLKNQKEQWIEELVFLDTGDCLGGFSITSFFQIFIQTPHVSMGERNGEEDGTQ